MDSFYLSGFYQGGNPSWANLQGTAVVLEIIHPIAMQEFTQASHEQQGSHLRDFIEIQLSLNVQASH